MYVCAKRKFSSPVTCTVFRIFLTSTPVMPTVDDCDALNGVLHCLFSASGSLPMTTLQVSSIVLGRCECEFITLGRDSEAS